MVLKRYKTLSLRNVFGKSFYKKDFTIISYRIALMQLTYVNVNEVTISAIEIFF